MDQIKFKISDLSEVDKIAITSHLDQSDYVLEVPKRTSGRHNELATLAIIGGINVVVAAAAYFFGKRNTNKIEIIVQTDHPNGSRQYIKLVLLKDEREPLDLQISKQISKALSV